MKLPRNAEHLAWYTRRDGKVRGPYSASHVTRYVLLGRIRLTDELSDDGASWYPLTECSECLPDEFGDLADPGDFQRLVMARISVEERRSQRRQDNDMALPAGVNERRTGSGRRQSDNNTEALACQLPDDGHIPGKQQRSSPLRACLLATLLLTLVVAWFSAAFR